MMKKNVFSIMLLMLVAAFPRSLSAQEESPSPIYGYQMGDEKGNYGFVSFTVDDWTHINVEKKKYITDPQICAAEYFDGKLYAYLVEADDYGNLYPYSYDIYDADTYNRLDTKDPIPYYMHDMAYDYTTNTMYGLVESEENIEKLAKANLCVIDMETGKYKVIGHVGNTLKGGALVTLACNSKGELYAMSEYRCFYKIDKNTGAATQIGEQHKLAVDNTLQSMTFDPSDRLYWAQQTPDYGWFTTIDYTTGVPTKLGTLGENAQITGLHFKREVNRNLPEKVSSLTAVTSVANPYEIKISWTNPSRTFGGETLTSLKGIRIYRMGTSEIIADISPAAPGANGEYTDVLNESGYQLYKLIPYSDEGVGFPAFIEVFSGYDQPQAVKELKLLQEDKTISLSWKAPTESVNGGYVDFDHLTYNVYRVRGTAEQLVSEKQTGTDFTETLSEIGGYSYKVTALAGDVEGISATTERILIQGVLSVPYSSGFEPTDDIDFWEIINHNTNGWSIGTGYGALSGAFAQCKTGGSSSGAADDWLVSPAIHMEKGLYSLKYYINGGYDKQNYAVAVGTSADPVSFTRILYEVQGYNNSSWEEISVDLQIDETGDYRLGWHVMTTETYATLKIDNVSVQAVPEFDASVTGLYVPVPSDKLNDHAPVSVVIENKGLKAFSKFKITAQTTYKTQPAEEVEQEIQPGDSIRYSLRNGVDFSEFGLHAVRVWIDLEGDPVQINDTTQIAFTYHVKPADIPFTIGFEESETEEMFGWNVSNDVSTDNQGWIVPVTKIARTGSQSMGYKASATGAADHWVYSKALNLKAAQSYKLTYYVLNTENDKTNRWNVCIGVEQTPGSMTETIGEKEHTGTGKQWKEITQLFTPEKDTVYYIGWHITSAAGMGDFCIDDISVTEIGAKDISIDKAIAIVPLNNSTAVKAFIRNNGTELIASYTLSYRVNDGNATTEVIETPIQPLETAEYTFDEKTDLSEFGQYRITVTAELTGDTNPDNDTYTFETVRSGDNDLDFEHCDDFEKDRFVTSQNKIWTSIDGDQGTPYQIGSYTYPHIGEPVALLAFNPDLTNPALTASTSFAVAEQGGKRYGLFMSVNYNTCDDWLVSPKVKVKDADAAFSMLARDVRSISSDIADFYIEIATTDAQPTVADFRKLTPDVCHTTTQWETYTYPLGDYVGQNIWIAVHHVSRMKYALLVDNLAFSGCEGSVTTGNRIVKTANLSIFPNPSEGYCEINADIPVVSYQLFDMQGRLLIHNDRVDGVRIPINTVSLPHGLYQVRIVDENDNCHVLKLICK